VLDPDPIFIVGAGRVGSALAALLKRAGRPPVGLWSRTENGAERARSVTGLECGHGAFPASIADARILILAVRDPDVPLVAGALLDGGLLRGARVVFHCGGAVPAREALSPITALKDTGTLHPLVAVANPEQAVRLLPVGFFAIEGEERARATARDLVTLIGARPFEIDAEAMTLYHAAAVLASNHAVALWHDAQLLLQQAGMDPELARAALTSLLRSTLENVEVLGLPDALTGPVRRGDHETVMRHLEALERGAPHLTALYRACTAAATRAARAAERDESVTVQQEGLLDPIDS
jgi:predicted short-subunit dehydrogenase-like oxidoreductase (DUF2520 family)